MALDDDLTSPSPNFGLRLYKPFGEALDEVTKGLPSDEQSEKTAREILSSPPRGVTPPDPGTQLAQAQTSGQSAVDWKSLAIKAEEARSGRAKPATKEDGPNFTRGFEIGGYRQAKQTAYGAAGLIGDTFGSESLKKWGLKGYKEASKEIEEVSKDSDSFTNALSSGELGKWFSYSSGYLLGQVAQMGAAALAGSALGSAVAPGAGTVTGAVTGAVSRGAVQTGIRGAIGKMIDKEAAAIVASKIESGVVREVAEREAAELAVKSVYRTIGATTANTFLNTTQSLGSVYGEAVEEAAKTGQEYSLGKVWLSGIASAAVDSWADSKALGGVLNAFKGRGGVSGIAMEALKGGFREGMTEGVQTVIERWGADKDLASKDAFKEYIDSAAVGILGGSMAGGAKGAVSKITGDRPSNEPSQPNLTALSPEQLKDRPVTGIATTYSADEVRDTLLKDGFGAALYERSNENQKGAIRAAIESFGPEAIEEFRSQWKDKGLRDKAGALIDNDPNFVQDFQKGLNGFVYGTVSRKDTVDVLSSNPEIAVFMYQTGDKDQKQTVRQAVERIGGKTLESFQQQLSDPDAVERGMKAVETYGNPGQLDALMRGIEELGLVQGETGVGNTKSGIRIDRRQAPSLDQTLNAMRQKLDASPGKVSDQKKDGQRDLMDAADEARFAEMNASLSERPDGASPLDDVDLTDVDEGTAGENIVAKFAAIGQEIFSGEMTDAKEGKYSWAVNQLRSAGYSVADARAILSGTYVQESVGTVDPDAGFDDAFDTKESITADRVSKAIQSGVELGRGGNAIVFDLPGTPYVVRVPKGSSAPKAADPVVPANDPFEGRNFGQPLFTVGNVQILRRQEGTPAGLTNYKTLAPEKANEQYEQAIMAAAQMPQEAYDQFAADLKYLNDKGARFDPSKSNNVLIDTRSGRFNLVDINQKESSGYKNSFGDMVITLIGNTYAWRYKGFTDLTEYRRAIYLKSLAAAQKAGLEINESDPSVAYSRKLAGLDQSEIRFSRASTRRVEEAPAPPPKNEVRDAKENLKDAAGNLFDVLTDVTGSKLNATGPQRSVSELPDALAKVMTAVGKLGYVKFKDVVREVMKRMRESKQGWAPLADKVTPAMLRAAYNKADIEGKESPEAVASVTSKEAASTARISRSDESRTGVRLTGSSPYLGKDQRKADKATKFIGRGSDRSSTAQYASDFGALANSGSYDASDVVFVSAEGARGGRVEPDFAEIKDAVTAGATILTDDASNRNRPYNVGERQVAEFLSANGYSESSPGEWRPSKKPAEQSQPKVNKSADQGLTEALTKAMEVSVKNGKKSLESAATDTMQRMRQSKKWSGRTSEVTPTVLRKAYKALPDFDGKDKSDLSVSANALADIINPAAKSLRQERSGPTADGERGYSTTQPKVRDAFDLGLEHPVLAFIRGGAAARERALNLRKDLLPIVRSLERLLSGAEYIDSQGKSQFLTANSINKADGEFLQDIFLLKFTGNKKSGDSVVEAPALLQNLETLRTGIRNAYMKHTLGLPLWAQQGRLDLPAARPEKLTAVERDIRAKADEIIMSHTRASFYEGTVARILDRLAQIDSELSELNKLKVEEGDKDKTFFRIRETTQALESDSADEMRYDRYSGSKIFDNRSPKNALLDERRRLSEELSAARQSGMAGMARLYLAGMRDMRNQLREFIITQIESRRIGREQGTVLFSEYMAANDALNLFETEQKAAEVSAMPNDVQEAVEEAHESIQGDFFEAQKTVLGLISDVKRNKLPIKTAVELASRGMKDGEFSYFDLTDGFRSVGISIPQEINRMASLFSLRVSLKDHIAQNKGMPSAADAYFANMQKAKAILGADAFNDMYPDSEIGSMEFWQKMRSDVAKRRQITDETRKSENVKEAFSGFLFSQITLEQARNPELIKNRGLRSTLTGMFDNLPEAWFQDVATALRLRPSLESGIFDYRVTTDGSSVVVEGAVSREDQAEFKNWVQGIKDRIQLESKMMARMPLFEQLRNLYISRGEVATLGRAQGYEGNLVQVTESKQTVTASGLVEEAEAAIQQFLSRNSLFGVSREDIQRVEGMGRGAFGSGLSRYRFVLKDGSMQGFENPSAWSRQSGYGSFVMEGLAVPELINVVLRGQFALKDGSTLTPVEFAQMRRDEGADKYQDRVISTITAPDKAGFQGRLFEGPLPGPAPRKGDGSPSAYESIYTQIANDELTSAKMAMDLEAVVAVSRPTEINPSTGDLRAEIQYLAGRFAAMEQESQNDPSMTETSDDNLLGLGDISTDEAVNADLIDAADIEGMSEFNEQARKDAESDQELDQERDNSTRPTEDSAEDEATPRMSKAKSSVPMSLEGGEQYRFRRGKSAYAATLNTVKQIVSEITAAWKNAPNVIVVHNVHHLPEGLRERVLEKLDGVIDAKGLYHNGDVYLFAQNLSSAADVEFTLLHETYGHLGMRAVLGAKFDQFLETAYRTRPEVRQQADALIASGMPKLEAIDEVLSDMAGQNKDLSIVKQWLGKIISGLREIGLQNAADWFASMTNAEVSATLYSARKAVQDGRAHAWVAPDPDLRFSQQQRSVAGEKSRRRSPYEMFSTTKDGKTTAYARYNPATESWTVFTATGADVRDGYTARVVYDELRPDGSTNFDQVIALMKRQGSVTYRLRSGLYVDDKVAFDLVKIKDFTEQKGWVKKLKRDLQIKFQNEYLPVFEVLDDLAAQGRVTQATDVKSALLAYERKASARLDDFRTKHVKPIMAAAEKLGKLGVNSADIDRFLVARHAAERNMAVAKINPSMSDGGSGLTYKQAEEIIAAVKSNPEAAALLTEIARHTDRMAREKIDYMLQTGLITQNAHAKFALYEHYVNLSGENLPDNPFDDPSAGVAGSKFNSQKPGEKRSMGRGEGNEAKDVLIRTIRSYEAALVRGQKNIVAQRALGFFETNYDPNFVRINEIPLRRALNEETGLVEYEIDDQYYGRPEVMVAKVNGIPVTMEFNDTKPGSFAYAIHGRVYPQDAGMIRDAFGKVTRFMGAAMTTYNPAFAFVNFFRDVQTMYFNSAADERISKAEARQMVRMLWPALKVGLYVASGKKASFGHDPELYRLFEQMKSDGGLTYFADRKGMEFQVDELKKLMTQGTSNPKKIVDGILGALEFAANASEVAPRLAAYATLIKNGRSREFSANYSGEVTVNFNMRGADRNIRQLYIFFNPAVQGAAKMYDLAFNQGANGKKQLALVAGGLTLLGFVTSLLGRAISGEDEEGRDKLDQVPLYKRSTSVVLSADTMGGAPIPIPYGWNAFFALGVFGADWITGKQSLATSAKRIALSAFEGLSPVGTGATDAKGFGSFLLKTFTPTAALPIAEMALNENRFGAPIAKNDSPFSMGKTPAAQQHFRGVSPISKAMTDFLTRESHGNSMKAGKIDINPAHIDFLIQSYLPGLPSDLYKGASLAIRASRGDEIKRAPWPVADRFSARIPTGNEYGQFRRAGELIETAFNEYKNTQVPGRRKEILEEFPNLLQAHGAVSTASAGIREIRSAIAKIEQRPARTEEEQAANKQRIKDLMDREEQQIKRANSRLLKLGGEVRERMLAND
jgi:hypothetical protein